MPVFDQPLAINCILAYKTVLQAHSGFNSVHGLGAAIAVV